MCKLCEGRAPLITTGCLSGFNIDIGIYGDKLIAEASYDHDFGAETVSKACQINYCPKCGRPLNYKRK